MLLASGKSEVPGSQGLQLEFLPSSFEVDNGSVESLSLNSPQIKETLAASTQSYIHLHTIILKSYFSHEKPTLTLYPHETFCFL